MTIILFTASRIRPLPLTSACLHTSRRSLCDYKLACLHTTGCFQVRKTANSFFAPWANICRESVDYLPVRCLIFKSEDQDNHCKSFKGSRLITALLFGRLSCLLAVMVNSWLRWSPWYLRVAQKFFPWRSSECGHILPVRTESRDSEWKAWRKPASCFGQQRLLLVWW